AFIPGVLMRRNAPPVAPQDSTVAAPMVDSLAAASTDSAGLGERAASGAPTVAEPPVPVAQAIPEDTIVVSSALYEYRISTRGGRIVGSRFLEYKSMFPGDTNPDGSRQLLELIPAGESLLDDRLVVG